MPYVHASNRTKKTTSNKGRGSRITQVKRSAGESIRIRKSFTKPERKRKVMKRNRNKMRKF